MEWACRGREVQGRDAEGLGDRAKSGRAGQGLALLDLAEGKPGHACFARERGLAQVPRGAKARDVGRDGVLSLHGAPSEESLNHRGFARHYHIDV